MESQQPEKVEINDSVNNTSDGEDDKDDVIVTMIDVLEQESEQEENANAVLGGWDEKKCTYSMGYLPRQPLYSCKTCCKDESAGICLSCSYNCHEGHDLEELYTKRHFRCDCGNSKFGDRKCSLDAIKDEMNDKNTYNQNFKGLYCVCKRPYPDAEDEVQDVMLQCVICEDWYHGRHLEGSNKKLEDVEEVICQLCAAKLPFLQKYVGKEFSDETDGKCKIGTVPDTENIKKEAIFWSKNWRKTLCRCKLCIEMYEKNQVSFLVDEEDSVPLFEAKNKIKASEIMQEREKRALSSLDHVQKVEMIQGFNDMKSALIEHLQKFKESNTVVSGNDIREFFDELQAKRRRLMQSPPAFR